MRKLNIANLSLGHSIERIKSEGGLTIVCINSHFAAKYVHETDESNANKCDEFQKSRVAMLVVRVERSDHIIGEYKGVWCRISNCEEEAGEDAAS